MCELIDTRLSGNLIFLLIFSSLMYSVFKRVYLIGITCKVKGLNGITLRTFCIRLTLIRISVNSVNVMQEDLDFLRVSCDRIFGFTNYPFGGEVVRYDRAFAWIGVAKWVRFSAWTWPQVIDTCDEKLTGLRYRPGSMTRPSMSGVVIYEVLVV